MSVLPDHEIEELCVGSWSWAPLIKPFDSAQLQPASYDVLLGCKILVPTERGRTVVINNAMEEARRRTVDLREPIPEKLYREEDITKGYVLYPGKFILGVTMERVCIPDKMIGRIEGKSSLGRLGITAHITAGFLDPGFRGPITLEIANFFPRPVRLWPDVKIAQLGFEWMSSACERPYGSDGLGSHYQDADGVQGTRYGG